MKPDDDSHDFTERQLASSHTFPGAFLKKSLFIFWLESQTEVINVHEKTYELCYNVISHQELLSVNMLMTSHYIRRSSFCLCPISYVELTLDYIVVALLFPIQASAV